MEIISTQKYLRLSPRKIRPVVSMVKKLTPMKAVEILPFIGKRASDPLRKVILTAMANAKDKGISNDNLIFKEIQINEGPRLKRGREVSRGRWHPIKKRMSHIRVVLVTKTEGSNTKSETNIKNAKKITKKAKTVLEDKGKEVRS
jgi:large subunit ribosomal protein L22